MSIENNSIFLASEENSIAINSSDNSDKNNDKNDTDTDNSINSVNKKFKFDYSKLDDLFDKLSFETDSIQLQIIINQYLQEITGAPHVFIVPVLSSSEEGLIQAVNDKILEKEIRFSVNTSNLNIDLHQNELPFVITDSDKDFNKIIEMVVGNTYNTLIFNIKNSKNNSKTKQLQDTSYKNTIENQPILIYICIAGDNCDYDNLKNIVDETFRYVLGHLLTAMELYEEKRVRGQCQNLLRIARRLLGNIADIGQLLRGVMSEAKDLAGAERCSLFLLDEYSGELVSKVFDGTDCSHEIRIENGKGIAGHVAKTGKLLNIRNAYTHPLFYKGVDERTGFKTRNILCFPICDEKKTIGVAQLCNKLSGSHFDKCDEEIATAFSIYCGISIMHAIVHKEVQKAEARHKLSQELLLYHMKVPETEVQSLTSSINFTSPSYPDLSSFIYNVRDVDVSITLQMSLQMFTDLKFLQTFKIREEKLVRFLLLVNRGYRDTPYHNWTHAFSVAHFAYSLMKNLKLIENGILSDLQGLAYLIACFCHDLDHRGTNNSYQMHSKSSLAGLYSSEGSVNERHHLSQAICILNEQNSKILDSLTTDEFKECIDYIRELILATDLAQHFRIFKDIQNLNEENIYDNQRLLMSLLITCSDLNDQIKPWPATHHVADLVYAEFFAQGDLEKQMGISPPEMMDRSKACIPDLQIEFIETVVRPTFEALSNIFPETVELIPIIDDNRMHWEKFNSALHKKN